MSTPIPADTRGRAVEPSRCGRTRVRGPLLLTAAILSECASTLMLQASAGFTRPTASLGVLAGYVLAILLFARALEHGLLLGIAYATLTGCGLVAATALSTLLFGEPHTAPQLGGLALILTGALVLQLTPGTHP